MTGGQHDLHFENQNGSQQDLHGENQGGGLIYVHTLDSESKYLLLLYGL